MVEFRIAETAAELEAVARFRYEVYVEEMGRHRSVARHVHRQRDDATSGIRRCVADECLRRRGSRHELRCKQAHGREHCGVHERAVG